MDEIVPNIPIVEVNHVCSTYDGAERFTQIILRDQYNLITDWRYIQNQNYLPTRLKSGEPWWLDFTETGYHYIFTVGRVKETWTLSDPERDEAQWRAPETRTIRLKKNW